jgi:aspartyl protease family protein
LRLYVQLIESHSSNTENGITTSYDGAKVEATLELTSEQLQDLKNKEEEMEVHSYKSLNEKTAPIKLKFQNGVYLVPVNLNNTLSIDFVLDLGASDVSISPDIFLVLYRAGTISESDFIGSQSYQFADGTIAKSSVFNIKSIQIGDREIKNIRASISNSLDAPLLLGQSALKKLDSYRIDNFQKVLIIE